MVEEGCRDEVRGVGVGGDKTCRKGVVDHLILSFCPEFSCEKSVCLCVCLYVCVCGLGGVF